MHLVSAFLCNLHALKYFLQVRASCFSLLYSFCHNPRYSLCFPRLVITVEFMNMNLNVSTVTLDQEHYLNVCAQYIPCPSVRSSTIVVELGLECAKVLKPSGLHQVRDHLPL
jgi:hypothetical protein